MNILVIDDVRIMDFECVYARNLYDARFYLFQTKTIWDEVWFDHDLGGDERIVPIINEIERRAMTGVYDYAEDSYLPQIRKCIVHTSNNATGGGRDYIVVGLRNAGYDVKVASPPVVGHL